MEYAKEERETVIRTDELMEHWDIFTAQRTFCTKIRNLKGVEILTEETTENGTVISGRYKLPLNQLSFRNHRALTVKQRSELSERAKRIFGGEDNA